MIVSLGAFVYPICEFGIERLDKTEAEKNNNNRNQYQKENKTQEEYMQAHTLIFLSFLSPSKKKVARCFLISSVNILYDDRLKY